jgi:hypothetical protein
MILGSGFISYVTDISVKQSKQRLRHGGGRWNTLLFVRCCSPIAACWHMRQQIAAANTLVLYNDRRQICDRTIVAIMCNCCTRAQLHIRLMITESRFFDATEVQRSILFNIPVFLTRARSKTCVGKRAYKQKQARKIYFQTTLLCRVFTIRSIQPPLS